MSDEAIAVDTITKEAGADRFDRQRLPDQRAIVRELDTLIKVANADGGIR